MKHPSAAHPRSAGFTLLCACLTAVLFSSCEVPGGEDSEGYVTRTNLSLGHLLNRAYEGAPLYYRGQHPSDVAYRNAYVDRGRRGDSVRVPSNWNDSHYPQTSRSSPGSFYPQKGTHYHDGGQQSTPGNHDHGQSHPGGDGSYTPGKTKKYINIY